MSTPRDSMARTLMLVVAGIASIALLIASIALLIRVKNAGKSAQPSPVTITEPGTSQNPLTALANPSGSGKRFTLRLGQGFRFKDNAVVKTDDAADVVFKYIPPQVGGLSTRYNP